MKISSFDNSKPITPATPAAGTSPAAAHTADKTKAAAPQTEASAKLALSPAAAQHLTEGQADFDAGKVARIAQAIRDGKFAIDPDKIADRLLAEARDMLAGPQH